MSNTYIQSTNTDYHSLGFLVQTLKNLEIILVYEIKVMNDTDTVIPF